MALKIAVDFDGTIVAHDYPRVGKPNPGALDALRMWKSMGCQLILWTLRCVDHPMGWDKDSAEDTIDTLTPAIEYCRENGVEFDAVNEGINDCNWTNSPKANADIYIDDLAIGCPIRHLDPHSGPVVDWPKIMGAVTQRIRNKQGQHLPNGIEPQ